MSAGAGFTLPPGEQFVSLVTFEGKVFAASTTRLWYLHPEHGLEPVEIVWAPEQPEREETQVFEGLRSDA